MEVIGNRFLIRIDKALQTDRREYFTYKRDDGTDFKVAIPSQYVDYTRNLQYGEIVSIGKKAAENFPEATIGDILIVDHFVEHKPIGQGDLNYYNPQLLGIEENGDELCYADCDHQVYGVFKPSMKTIVPYKEKIFCHIQYLESEMIFKERDRFSKDFKETSTGVTVFKEYEMKSQVMLMQLEELKNEVDHRRQSSQYTEYQRLAKMPVVFMPLKERVAHENKLDALRRKIEDTEKRIREIEKERAEISEMMNESRFFEFTLLFINPSTELLWNISLRAGDKIIATQDAAYPLEFMGLNYSLIDTTQVILLKKQDSRDYTPLYNWVIIKPDAPSRTTNSGLILPDSAVINPNTGTVFLAGPDCVINAGQKVRFLRAKHLPMNINGVEYLIMKEEKLLNKFDDRKVKATR